MNMARSMAVLLATFLLAAGTALAGEAGTALKADDLKAEPFRDAKTVGSLTAGDTRRDPEEAGRMVSGEKREGQRMGSHAQHPPR